MGFTGVAVGLAEAGGEVAPNRNMLPDNGRVPLPNAGVADGAAAEGVARAPKLPPVEGVVEAAAAEPKPPATGTAGVVLRVLAGLCPKVNEPDVEVLAAPKL